jgi:glutathione-regulated potassium-efflux system ancillary protein KefC
MALTPLLLIAYNQLLVRSQTGQSSEADIIDDNDAPVIIAGFGRVGQVVGRLLFASGIKVTVLDHDPVQIELLRRFAFKVYYGDATRIDLLEAAGAANAKLLVVAIDDPEMSARLVDAVREHFPDLLIVARARNVGHWAELRSRGIHVVERETFESSLLIGRHV